MAVMSKTSILAIFGLAALASASGYVEFCSNEDFTDCGIAVSTQNHGCLQGEAGRKSLKFTEGDSSLFFPVLVGYSDDNCQNEVGCNAVGEGGSEQNIDFEKAQEFKFALESQSFKWLEKCPNGCTGICSSRKRSRIEGNNDLVASANVTAAAVEKRQDGADFQFCDDDACSVNCGNRIEPNSAGCANGESGRKSALFKGTSGTVVLGAFDNSNCYGSPVTTFDAKNGCNVLPSQHESWQVVGISG